MINTILVDDEANSREILKNILEKNCPDIHIVDICKNVEEAYVSIVKNEPNLVFLDIEMPPQTGFDLLSKFSNIHFDVVFTTAHNDYALQAIEFNCLSYILKPLSIEKVILAVEKVKSKHQNLNQRKQLENLLYNLNQSPNRQNNKIALPTLEGLEFILVSNIIRLEADGSCTRIFAKDGTNILTTRNLKEFETLLEGYSFCRVHRKSIININFISKYYKGEGGYVIMADKSNIAVSRRRKDAFLEMVNKL